MKKSAPNRIAEFRKARGLTQSQLAEKLNVHWVTISKLERGRMQLSMDWLQEIANALDVQITELIAKTPETKTVAVVGALEKDGTYFDFGENWWEMDMPLALPGELVSFWIVVEGSYFWPQFHDGDKLHFINVDEAEAASYVGRFVLGNDTEGSVHIGYLLSATEDAIVDIQKVNGPVVRGVRLENIAVLGEVRFTQPWELAQTSTKQI